MASDGNRRQIDIPLQKIFEGRDALQQDALRTIVLATWFDVALEMAAERHATLSTGVTRNTRPKAAYFALPAVFAAKRKPFRRSRWHGEQKWEIRQFKADVGDGIGGTGPL